MKTNDPAIAFDSRTIVTQLINNFIVASIC